MAVNPQAALLTEQHRQAQTRNAALVALLVARLWQSRIDTGSVASSAAEIFEAILPILLRQRGNSAAMARTYAAAFRQLELGRLEPFVPEPAVLVDPQIVRDSLWSQGPAALEKKLEKISGRDVSPAIERALVREAVETTSARLAGSAIRHVRNGGRAEIDSIVQQDKRALGHVRVTSPDCCYFCAMLASRGPTYKGDSFRDSNSLFSGAGIAKVHDHCGCEMQPIYSRKDKGLDQSREFEQLWIDATKGKSGKDAILAFRRAYEGRAEAS